ncbi:MAG: hypothetical protein OXD36_16765 [Rhodobacter sp.]|nr:hypothetical protein [Rhodobacter sp.]MCY4243379.1 hypothetical protein [Rhodobacter sp.]
MPKNTMFATLSVVLFLFGTGTASADRVSLCEHWYGDPVWTCGFAFIYSEARKNCEMQVSDGFPRWSDRDLNSLDPDNLNESQSNLLATMQENWGHACECKVRIQCTWIGVSSNGWIAVPSPQTSNHECSATPDSLRAMRFHEGRMTPDC